jgi:hypothetical protein
MIKHKTSVVRWCYVASMVYNTVHDLRASLVLVQNKVKFTLHPTQITRQLPLWDMLGLLNRMSYSDSSKIISLEPVGVYVYFVGNMLFKKYSSLGPIVLPPGTHTHHRHNRHIWCEMLRMGRLNRDAEKKLVLDG